MSWSKRNKPKPYFPLSLDSYDLPTQKRCPQCTLTKPINCFTKRKKPRNKKGNPEWLSICKSCYAHRSKKWMFQNPQRYLQYQTIKKSYQTKSNGCAYCKKPGELVWWRIDNQRGKYHPICAQQRERELNVITPQRRKELLEIANS